LFTLASKGVVLLCNGIALGCQLSSSFFELLTFENELPVGQVHLVPVHLTLGVGLIAPAAIAVV
jgi:hypothetical protein